MRIKKRIYLFSVLAGLLVAVSVSLIYSELNKQEHAHIEKASVTVAKSVKALIQNDLHSRIRTLLSFAERWNAVDLASRDDWEAGAINILAAKPGYQAIGWIDPAFTVRRIVPLNDNEGFENTDIWSYPSYLNAAKSARDKNNPVLTKPSRFSRTDNEIAVFNPVFRNKQLDGIIFAVISTESWLKSLLPPVYSAEHDVTVKIGGETVYSQVTDGYRAEVYWRKEQSFTVYDQKFRIETIPKTDYLKLFHARFIKIMLIAGILLSGLAMLAVYTSMSARYRFSQFHALSSQQRRLLENLPGMAYQSSDRNPREMPFVSQGCKALCGYESADLENNQVLWSHLIYRNDREWVENAVRKAICTNTPFEIEYRIHTKDGKVRWMWERGRATYGFKVQSDRVLEGFITDITERKHTESELLQEQAFSAAIVDSAFEAVITLGTNNHIEAFNPAAQQIFGYTKDQIKGTDFLDLLEPEQSKVLRESLNQFWDTGELNPAIRGFKANGIHRNCAKVPLEVSVSQIQLQTKRRLVCLVRDISKQRAAEREALAHREKLAHADRINTLGEMVTGIAHEINQPLTTISLFSQVGKRLLESGKYRKLDGIFDKLSDHAQRAGIIIERIQNMARQHSAVPKIISCNDIIEEIASLAEADARRRNIVIDLNLCKGLPPIEVDSVQIQQVVLNILRNGMEAMQSVDCRHGNGIEIQTSLLDESTIEIAVIDSGCGITEEVAEKLFKPFSTTKDSGIGIGLSISQSIVSAHGGCMRCYNNSTCGATFSFTIPIARRKK